MVWISRGDPSPTSSYVHFFGHWCCSASSHAGLFRCDFRHSYRAFDFQTSKKIENRFDVHDTQNVRMLATVPRPSIRCPEFNYPIKCFTATDRLFLNSPNRRYLRRNADMIYSHPSLTSPHFRTPDFILDRVVKHLEEDRLVPEYPRCLLWNGCCDESIPSLYVKLKWWAWISAKECWILQKQNLPAAIRKPPHGIYSARCHGTRLSKSIRPRHFIRRVWPYPSTGRNGIHQTNLSGVEDLGASSCLLRQSYQANWVRHIGLLKDLMPRCMYGIF